MLPALFSLIEISPIHTSLSLLDVLERYNYLIRRSTILESYRTSLALQFSGGISCALYSEFPIGSLMHVSPIVGFIPAKPSLSPENRILYSQFHTQVQRYIRTNCAPAIPVLLS